MFTGMLAVSCEKPALGEVESKSVSKKVSFHVSGDFDSPVFTRGSLASDGNEMTDLWLFDYVDGQLSQQIHQVQSNEDFGCPAIVLGYGMHTMYFVASRGDTPSVDTDSQMITWDIPRDTFWETVSLTVDNSSSTSQSVTLQRVATKLRVAVKDEVPVGCASLSLTPTDWFYGLDYMTGQAVENKAKERVVAVPDSYIGTTGSLSMSIFGISGIEEWMTDVELKAMDSGGNAIGTVTIMEAPFKRNRATEYSGCLFGSGSGWDVSIDDTWQQSFVGEW